MSRKAWTALAGMILGGTDHAAVISTGLGVGGGECNVTNIGTQPVMVAHTGRDVAFLFP